MKNLKTLILAVATLATGTAALAGTASAQDYNDWSSISPYGLEMQDELGNIYYVDPYAYDSRADIYGNVYSSYNYDMDPSIGTYDLTPAWQGNTYGSTSTYGSGSSSSWSYLDSNPYAGSTDSQGQFLSMIWE